MYEHKAVIKENRENRLCIIGDNDQGLVLVVATEIINDEVVNRGEIKLSNEGFITLVGKTLNEMGYGIILEREMF